MQAAKISILIISLLFVLGTFGLMCWGFITHNQIVSTTTALIGLAGGNIGFLGTLYSMRRSEH